MRRFVFTSLATTCSATVAFAQFPPTTIRDPDRLPPGLNAQKPDPKPLPGEAAKAPKNGSDGLPLPRPDVPLVRAENGKPLGTVDVKLANTNWQVWVGSQVFANLGTDWKTAEKMANLLKAMQAGETGKIKPTDITQTSWATLGETRPVIGYMSVRGEAIRKFSGVMNTALPIDLETLRREEVRGIWVVRDNQNILLNFGLEQREAEQAVAVARRFGFNRIGFIGGTDAPSMRYFFAAADADVAKNPQMIPANPALTAAFQELSLDGTGVEIPNFGTVGQKRNLDMKSLSLRKDGAEYTLIHGSDVMAKFGRDEWSARETIRTIQQMKPTSMVHIGQPGITFFLTGNEPPRSLPFGTQGAAFDSDRISIRQTVDGVFHLYDSVNREIASVKTQKDVDAVRAAIRHFKLNRTCQIGTAASTSFTFLARVN